jgi:hypothetical protein
MSNKHSKKSGKFSVFLTFRTRLSHNFSKKQLFHLFSCVKNSIFEKEFLPDFVLRKQNARAQCAAAPVEMCSKWSVSIGGWIARQGCG